MNTITSIVTAVGLTTAVFGLSGAAAAAPQGAGDAEIIISQLEARGHRVIVHRQGNTALKDATLVSVRPGPEFTRWVWDAQRDDRIRVPAGRTYFVSIE